MRLTGPFLAHIQYFILLFFAFAQKAEAQEQIEIVVSVPFLANLVDEVSCKKSELHVQSLAAAGTDPHTYSLTPHQRSVLSNATLVFAVGTGFEPWLEALKPTKSGGASALAQTKTQVAKNSTRWVFVTDSLSLQPFSSQNGDRKVSAAGSLDPHIWQSPSLTIEAAKVIAEQLKTLRPELAPQFDKCFGTFKMEVEKEVGELKSKIGELPPQARVLATNHDAFGYFARTFGLEIVSVVGVSTDAAPTPQQLKSAIMKVRESKVKSIFLETTAPKTLLESLSRETGVKIGGALYADGLGEQGSGAETVLKMWKKNVNTLFSALR